MEGRPLTHGLPRNHAIRQSFRWLQEGDDAQARDVFRTEIQKSNDNNSDTDWYVNLDSTWEIFKDIVGFAKNEQYVCQQCGGNRISEKRTLVCY